MHQFVLTFPLGVDYAKTSLVLSTTDERIRITGLPAPTGLGVISTINSGDEVNKGGSESETSMIFLQILMKEGLLVRRDREAFSGKEISNWLSDFYERSNNKLFSHRLWYSLANGTAKQCVVDGWLKETYHFIKGANARLAYAVAHCNDFRCQAALAHHYVEEYDHHRFFSDSLERRNISVESVEAIGPLPSTNAVINMARYAARVDFLAYAACSGLLESTGSDSSRAREFYALIEKHYDSIGSEFVAPLIEHVDLDERFEHGNVMDDIFKPFRLIDVERADRIAEVLVAFEETLLNWFDEIADYYLDKDIRLLNSFRCCRNNPPR